MSEVVRNLRACNALLLPNSYAQEGVCTSRRLAPRSLSRSVAAVCRGDVRR